MNPKKELTLVALSSSESQPGNYVLILEEPDQQQRIPMIIGTAEAQAIAVAMEQMQPARPLTHDLLKSAIEILGGTVTEVLIHHLADGVFYCNLMLQKPDGSTVAIDTRPSDAFALAVRWRAPIYALESVIMEAGIMAETLSGRQIGGSLAAYSLAELEDLLQKVIAKEDYESASKLRDYIQKRKEGPL